jgi:hypothetical protein
MVVNIKKNVSYFFNGAVGTAAGCAASGLAAGIAELGIGAVEGVCRVTGIFERSISDELLCDAVYVSVKDVSIKIIATAAVIFPKKVPAPVEPKTVWLEPPKAAPILAPLPACRRTTKIMIKQANTCIIVTRICILNPFLFAFCPKGDPSVMA